MMAFSVTIIYEKMLHLTVFVISALIQYDVCFLNYQRDPGTYVLISLSHRSVNSHFLGFEVRSVRLPHSACGVIANPGLVSGRKKVVITEELRSRLNRQGKSS